MSQTIKLKRSAVAGKVPTTSSLDLGELAVNTYDGKAYLKKDDGLESIQSFVITDSTTTGSINLLGDVTASNFLANNSVTTGYLSSSYIDLDVLTNGDIPSHKAGRIFFGAEDGALEVYNEEADITLQVGQEFWVRVYNGTPNPILNGTPVRISGSQGDRPKVFPALAEDHTSGPVFDNHIIGVTTHDIPGSSVGYATAQGIVRNVNTNGFNAGDILFLQTGSAGFRNTPPPFPYDVVQVGYVARKATNGFVFVEPKEPVHFSNISGLSGSYTPDVGDLWVYQSNGAWTHTNVLPSVTASGIFSGSFNGTGLISSASYVDFQNIDNKPTLVSGSSQIDVTQTTNYDQVVNLSGNQTITGTKTFTSDNIFNGNQIFNNITVEGSASIAYLQSVSGSAKIIGDAFIILNNNIPAQPTAGITVIDSGSTGVTASFFWDGDTDDWKYEYNVGVDHEGAVALFGPEGTGSANTFPYPTLNYILKSDGKHHLNDSQIKDDGTTVDIANNLVVTGSITAGSLIGTLQGIAATASYVEFANVANKPTLLSGSNQIATEISGAFTLVSSSLALGISNNDIRLDVLEGKTLISSSAQISSEISGAFTFTSESFVNTISLLSQSFASGRLKNTTDTLTGDLTVTGRITAQEFYTEIVSASILFESGSTKFGDTIDDTHQFTGSVNISGSLNVDGTITGNGIGITNIQSASFANTSISSSYASTALSSSFAFSSITASYALNAGAGAGFPFSGSAVITGSLLVTGDVSASLFSGSFYGDGSNLTGIVTTVNEITTVTDTFTSSTSKVVTHNFNSKNVIVSVYDNSDNLIIPQSIVLTDSNNVTVTFSSPESGFIVVAKGGHIVSGSVTNISSAISTSFSNGVLTDNGDGTINAENNLTFNGSELKITGSIDVTSFVSSSNFEATAQKGLQLSNNNGYIQISTGTTKGYFGKNSDDLYAQILDSTNADFERFYVNLGGIRMFSVNQTNISNTGKGRSVEVENVDFSVDFDTLFVDEGLDRVGINTVNPSEALEVVGNLKVNGDTVVTGKITAQEFHTEFVSASIIYQSGSTKFGDTFDDTHQFTGSVAITGSAVVQGNLQAGNTTVTSLTETSTRALKTSIEPLEAGNDVVSLLQPVKYIWKETEESDFGLIAEEVNEIFPFLVTTDSFGEPTGIKYSKLNVILINCIKEQNKTIDNLSNRLTELENIVSRKTF